MRWPYLFRGILLAFSRVDGCGVGGGEAICAGGADTAFVAHEAANGFIMELLVDSDGVRIIEG